MAAFTTAHSAPAARARELRASGTMAFPPTSLTTFCLVFPVRGAQSVKSETTSTLKLKFFPSCYRKSATQSNFPKFEFIRLVAGTPGRGITPPPPPTFYPGWLFTDFFFLTEARGELQRRAGGPYVENVESSLQPHDC